MMKKASLMTWSSVLAIIALTSYATPADGMLFYYSVGHMTSYNTRGHINGALSADVTQKGDGTDGTVAQISNMEYIPVYQDKQRKYNFLVISAGVPITSVYGVELELLTDRGVISSTREFFSGTLGSSLTDNYISHPAVFKHTGIRISYLIINGIINNRLSKKIHIRTGIGVGRAALNFQMEPITSSFMAYPSITQIKSRMCYTLLKHVALYTTLRAIYINKTKNTVEPIYYTFDNKDATHPPDKYAFVKKPYITADYLVRGLDIGIMLGI